MEYTVNTIFNINDKIYSINNFGNINTYHINEIDFEGLANDKGYSFNIIYSVANSSGKCIERSSATEIQKRYFLDKKDIIKHITDQL